MNQSMGINNTADIHGDIQGSIVAVTTIAVLVFAVILQLYTRFKPHAVDKSLPGPKRHPLIGILKFMLEYGDRMYMADLEFCAKYQSTWGGPVPKLGAMSGSYFVISDEKNMEHVLGSNFDNYEKSDLVQSVFSELLGNGIFVVDGPTWYHHRKIASRMFSTNLVREGSKVTLKKVQELSALLNAASSTGKEIDIQDFFFRMTFDITCVVSFGVEYGSLQSETQHPFALAFDEMQELMVERLGDPLFELKRFFNVGPREKRIRELKVILDENAKEIIQGRRRTAKDGTLGPDILSRFMDYATNQNDPISDEELRDIILNFLVAGRDTTAVALSWALFELCKHPEIVANMLEEANEICGRIDGDNDGDYSFDTIQKLKYIDAVVMEVLRLHPSVPKQSKYAVDDDILPDGTFIPNGAMVSYTALAMGRSIRAWGSDAGEFKPTRFFQQREPSVFRNIVFNAGKRMCLGKPMAINTLKLALAYLVQRFEFKDIQGHDGTLIPFPLISKMKGGFPIQVAGRET
ncbi:Leukotriene-B(4) omega-hydroxylase 2 [Seminavis robusta]|uniref:Leukotriene-B(4) omega-hydroxylase 2 n=1 Tax=Seminavis robusta TaxID=568900 RepID=A0A9N8DP50_9STRA|nr:Leukotriene-B(4) omega-hydroxylase 2 [Seminavis robusta]|eukprot:Sro255_g100320.1 Leukotriene-B(4) omega-hydroxylase 2 (520) ;mRNA; f:19057-20616